MRAIIAIAVTAALLTASVAGAGYYLLNRSSHDHEEPGVLHLHDDGPPGADVSRLRGGAAGDPAHAGHGASPQTAHHSQSGMYRPAFPPAEGSVPTAEEAKSLEQVSRLVIRADKDFVPANGVRSGSGTLADPYVITGFYVTGNLHVADTDACVVVKENYIGGQLILNWNDQCVHAHHNYIGDLRVNQNVKRTGMPTGGLIELNQIDYIGQLRHFDGEFRHNVVGPRAVQDMFGELIDMVPGLQGTDVRIANVDGFNQGLLHHNTFHGSIDLKFHGHHHATGFEADHSHYHGSNETRADEHPHDHTQRWTSVFFTDNVVIDPEGYGLRYTDRNHAGDDRTANSEDEETLRDPHRHFTHVVLARNVLEGAPIWIDVFNADDKLHYERNPGRLEVTDNIIRLQERTSDEQVPLFGPNYDPRAGIHVSAAKEVQVSITGNHVRFLAAPEDNDGGVLGGLWPFQPSPRPSSGLLLSTMKDSQVLVEGNTFEDFHYGVRAERFDEQVSWTVSGNRFVEAQYPVYYDDSVPNHPAGTDG